MKLPETFTVTLVRDSDNGWVVDSVAGVADDPTVDEIYSLLTNDYNKSFTNALDDNDPLSCWYD